MGEYGVTDKGFVIKRMDAILNEIHEDLTEGFGIDTRFSETSFLNVLVTTFAGQISDLWEMAQDSYYAKYPATATGVNLDNAVQYGGIRRKPSKRTCYLLHCTGTDGTIVRGNTLVATNTTPEKRLYSASDFKISREECNSISIKVASLEQKGVYTVTINGTPYSYANNGGNKLSIIRGLETAIDDSDYIVEIDDKNNLLQVFDKMKSRKNNIVLTSNLTSHKVTSIANFYTEEFGKIDLPNGIVEKIINNISGFDSVTNVLNPVYGRLQETDIELRQSYIAKSALRSNTMVDSIVSEILNNVADTESATGYENCSDFVDIRGLPPHSVEIIVEGGDDVEIAKAILRRKAGGIQTYGRHTVSVAGNYGDPIPISFNRPYYIYAWLKVIIHGEKEKIPSNYDQLAVQSLLEYTSDFVAGDNLLIQMLNEGMYKAIAGITYIEIFTAYSDQKTFIPLPSDYEQENIMATARHKILLDKNRIEVSFSENI